MRTDNINLSLIDNKGLGQFFEQYKEKVSNIHTITFETGDYGMILFSKLVDTWMIDREFKIDEKIYTLAKPNINNKEKFTLYTMGDGTTIKIVLNEKLNLKTNIKDVKTGFPITSETLYFKKIENEIL